MLNQFLFKLLQVVPHCVNMSKHYSFVLLTPNSQVKINLVLYHTKIIKF